MPVYSQRNPQYVEHVQGGEGRMKRDMLLPDDKLGGVCTYISQITLEPGCSIGIHQHSGDAELYFITTGTGTYTENNTDYTVTAGDALYCADGSTHGLVNNGEELLQFVAVIQKTPEQ